MKNNIEKLIHNWSTNIVRLGFLVVVLIGTSEWLMHTSKVNEIEYSNFTKDQQIEEPLSVLKKAISLTL